jgi:hypothetical protein
MAINEDKDVNDLDPRENDIVEASDEDADFDAEDDEDDDDEEQDDDEDEQ